MQRVSKEKQREDELHEKAKATMRRFADISNTAPMNTQVIFNLAVLEWKLYQKYRGEGVAHYISRKAYNTDMNEIMKYRAKIISGAKHEKIAVQAVDEAKEFLRLMAEYRVRQPRPRVF